MSTSITVIALAVPQLNFWRVVVTAISASPSSLRGTWHGRAEPPDEHERDDRDADEDQDGDRRPDAQVQRREQGVVAEDRDRVGPVAAPGPGEAVVEHS